MLGVFQRIKEFYTQGDREKADARKESGDLEEELTALQNEMRFQEEPAFASHLKRLVNDLEGKTRFLIYETKEPERSALQGRCQMLLEEIERPSAVKARARDIQDRLVELRGVLGVSDDGSNTVERDATENGR